MQLLLHQLFAPSSEEGNCWSLVSCLFASIVKYRNESELSRKINDHPEKSRLKYPDNLSAINAGVITRNNQKI